MNTRTTFPRISFGRLAALLVVAGLTSVACDGQKDVLAPPGGGGQLPVANAGPDQTVSAHVPVKLDGSASTDPGGAGPSYEWSLTSMPPGSGAALDDPTAERPSFVPDLAGEYRLGLVVSNGAGSSAPDEVAISAEDHTATATVGAAGGDVVSKDGNFTLSFPAGALAADAEIRLTRVLPDQYPDVLADLPDEAGVYAVAKTGAEVTAPITVRVRLPDPVENEEGQLQASPWVVGRLVEAGPQPSPSHAVEGSVMASGDGSEIVPLEGHRIDAISDQLSKIMWLGADGELDIGEFWDALDQQALIVYTRILVGDPSVGIERPMQLIADFPTSVPQGTETELAIEFRPDPATVGWFQDQTTNGNLSFKQSDASTAGFELIGDYSEYLSWSQNVYRSSNTGECTSSGTIGADVEISLKLIGLNILEGKTFNITWQPRRDFVCEETEPPLQPFTSLTLERVEGSLRGPQGQIFGFGGAAGGVRVGMNGDNPQQFDGIPQTETVFGPILFNLPIRHFGVYSSGGVYTAPDADGTPPGATGAALAEPLQLTRADLTVPGITDNTGNTTDGIPYNNDPSAQGWLLTQFEDRNILFLVPGGNDVMVDPNLAEAFYNGGQSVFGSARPISAFAGPNGFTANDPMLAVTIADDGSGAGEVLKLDLVNGKAVATPVGGGVFVQPEPRRIRCLSGICAASSFGKSGGFGGVMFFSWDGQDGFNFIINRATYAIGIDMIQDGSRILVASTDFFNNTYAIDELTTGGQYVGFEIHPVPEGCVGPGHVIFRSTRDVVLSCNTSGLVVGDVFDPAP